MSTHDLPEWRLRWPGAVDRVEMWEGNLAFEIRNHTGQKASWTDDDVNAACLVYPDQQVAMSPAGTYLFVGPTAEALAAAW